MTEIGEPRYDLLSWVFQFLEWTDLFLDGGISSRTANLSDSGFPGHETNVPDGKEC